MYKILLVILLISSPCLASNWEKPLPKTRQFTGQAQNTGIIGQHRCFSELGNFLEEVVNYLKAESERQCSHNITSVQNLAQNIPPKPSRYKGKGSYMSSDDVMAAAKEMKNQMNDQLQKVADFMVKFRQQHHSRKEDFKQAFIKAQSEIDLMIKNCRNNSQGLSKIIQDQKSEINKKSSPLMSFWGRK